MQLRLRRMEATTAVVKEDPGIDAREERGMATLNVIGVDIIEISMMEGTDGLTRAIALPEASTMTVA